jgi:hypothetical protein
MTWMAWAAWGKPSLPACSVTVTTFRVRSSIRPRRRSVLVFPTGTSFQGSVFSRASSGLVARDAHQQVGTTTA